LEANAAMACYSTSTACTPRGSQIWGPPIKAVRPPQQSRLLSFTTVQWLRPQGVEVGGVLPNRQVGSYVATRS
jgi:hypothetical protein